MLLLPPSVMRKYSVSPTATFEPFTLLTFELELVGSRSPSRYGVNGADALTDDALQSAAAASAARMTRGGCDGMLLRRDVLAMTAPLPVKRSRTDVALSEINLRSI